MAKSPLPILLAVGALFYLKIKGSGDADSESSDLPAPGDNTTGEPDPGDGNVATVPAPGLEPGGALDPAGTNTQPVSADTSGPSGYSTLTLAQMMVIQSRLTQLGFDPGKIDGKWVSGGNTYGAVRGFQSAHGLQVDGRPGPNTQSTLDAVIGGTWVVPGPSPDGPTKPSGYSDLTIDEMKTIQNRLALLGFDPGVIDGKWIYGGNTYDAVREFQGAHGLQVDGKPGPNTQYMIGQVTFNPTAPPDPIVEPIVDPVVYPTVEVLPPPVPADDPNLFVIDTKLEGATSYPGFKSPMLLVEKVRSTGLGKPKGFSYGYDIYQDQDTLGGDGSFIGVTMAKTDGSESSTWIYRSKPASKIASANDRVKQLSEKLEWVVSTLETEMV